MRNNIEIDFIVRPRKRTVANIVFGSFLSGASLTLFAQAWEHGWITTLWSFDAAFHLFLIAQALWIVLPSLRRLKAELLVDTAQTVHVRGADGPATVEVAGHYVANDGTVTPKNLAD